jgi:hypothetical protein
MTDSPFSQGPYLSAAFLCERLLNEQDNVKSAIRIIDRITRGVTGPEPPETMEPFEQEMTIFLRFKSGWARGSFQLRLEVVKPSGDGTTLTRQTVIFEGEEDRGVDIVGPMRMRVEMPGLYWFEVYLNEVLITRIPFRVVYTTTITPRAGSGGG